MYLLTIAGIWAIAAATPGPNFFVVAQSALSGSRMAALAAAAGVATGTLVWGFAGWLGISAMFSAVPTAYLLLKLGAVPIWFFSVCGCFGQPAARQPRASPDPR